MAGYSGTPLAAKLGVKPGMTMRVVHAPDGYDEPLAPLPDGARVTSRGRAGIVHHFARRASELTGSAPSRCRSASSTSRSAP